MSTETNVAIQPPEPVEQPLSMRELATLLVKHYGLHDGFFDLMIEFHIGVGTVGPRPDALAPGAMVGISRVGLTKTEKLGPTTVDAAVVNPPKPSVRKKSQ